MILPIVVAILSLLHSHVTLSARSGSASLTSNMIRFRLKWKLPYFTEIQRKLWPSTRSLHSLKPLPSLGLAKRQWVRWPAAAKCLGRKWGGNGVFLRSSLERWLGGPYRGNESSNVANGNAKRAESKSAVSGFGDTAFTENRNRRLHRWVPWIAGYSSSFVDEVLDRVRNDDQPLQVLDPFAGVGTTLISAMESGDNAIGFEINPYAALACRAKVGAAHYDVGLLETAIEAFDDFGDEKLWMTGAVMSSPPPSFRSRVAFFSPDVEHQVLACLDFINSDTDGWVRTLFQLALGSVMVSFSNYSYEPSLGTRAAAGKPNVEEADVIGIVRSKLFEMQEDIISLQEDMIQQTRIPSARVHAVSYMENAGRLLPQNVDVVVTSPPYLNNYHYIRNTRPQMFWLGLVNETADLKVIERKSFGQFWQTVRTEPEIALNPKLPHLADQIQDLRSRNADRGAYGGAGWANYATTYFNDCERFCKVTRPLMKPGGTMMVVIGNNILQGMEFQTDRYFAQIAELEGFEIAGLHEVRGKRTGNSVVNSSVRVGKVSKPTRLYETAVELRSP